MLFAFDEVADLQKMPKEVVTTLKTYCEFRHVCPRERRPYRYGLHSDVRKHQPGSRRDGAFLASIHAHAGG